jgi:4-amino-4-deoxy-L-arabinose transferase-like glycosyltransferase
MSGPARATGPGARWWRLGLVLLLAAALRTYGVRRQPLRGDEAFSVTFSAQAPSAIVAQTGTAEPNPPLYWFLLHGWMRLAGSSELAVRWPSVLAGVVAVAATARLGAALAGRRAGALAALLAAASPFLIWYAQDARAYSLLAALVTAATWLTWRAARQPAPARWLAAGGLWWLALFTHYFAALPALAVGLALVLAPATRPRWRAAALMAAGVGLAYLPWGLYVAPLLAGHEKAWTAAPAIGEALWRSLAAAAVGLPGTGATIGLRQAGAAVLGLLAAWGGRWALRRRPSAGAWLLTASFVPTLLLWLISLARPVYAEQYVFASVPALLALAAVGAARLARAWWPGAAAASAVLLIGLLTAANAAFDPAYAKSPDWRALNDYLARTARPGEVVVVNLPEPAFYYYYSGAMPALTAPPRPLDASSQPEAEAQLRGLRDRYAHVRLLLQPTPGYDPEGFVGRWLADCCELTGDEFVRGWHVQAFDTPAGSLAARQPLEAGFENGLALTGYRVVEPALRPGQTLRLTLYWRASAPVTDSYTVFVHLLAADGFEAGNADSLPAGGRQPTTTWAPGSDVIDPHALPLDPALPSGHYALEVGLYQLASGTRLPTATGDAVRLPVTIRLLAP